MALTIFNSEFLEHLAAELGCEVSEIEKAIASFGEASPAPEPVKPTRKNVPPKPPVEKPKASTKKSNAIEKDDEDNSEDDVSEGSEAGDGKKHTCDRIPRGKTDACGKNAKNCIEGEDGNVNWYCGTENSGCYKSILLGQKRQTKAVASKPRGKQPPGKKESAKAPPAKESSKASTKKPSTNTDKKSASDVKTKSLVHKVTKHQTLDVKKIKVGEKVLWFDSQTRAVFDRDTKEAYAILGKDNKTIKPLTDEDIRLLEASGVPIRVEEKGKKASKTDEDDLDESQSDDEEDDIDLGDDDDEEEKDDEDDIDLGSGDDE